MHQLTPPRDLGTSKPGVRVQLNKALNEPPLLHREAENFDISTFHNFHGWFLSPRVCGSMGGSLQLRVLTLLPSPAEREGWKRGHLVQASCTSPICVIPGLHSGFSRRFSQTLQHNPSRSGPAPRQTRPKGQRQSRRARAARTTASPAGKNLPCWKMVVGEVGRGRSLHEGCRGLASRAGRAGLWVLVRCPAGRVVGFRGGFWCRGQVGEHWARLAQLGTSLSGSEGVLFQEIKGEKEENSWKTPLPAPKSSQEVTFLSATALVALEKLTRGFSSRTPTPEASSCPSPPTSAEFHPWQRGESLIPADTPDPLLLWLCLLCLAVSQVLQHLLFFISSVFLPPWCLPVTSPLR